MGIAESLATLVNFVLSIYVWFIVLRVLLSWVNPDPYNPVVQMLVRATDPVLVPLRQYIPPIAGLDLSPIVALFGIQMVQRILVTILQGGGGGGFVALLTEMLGLVHLLGTLYMVLLFVRAGFHFHSWHSFRHGRPASVNLRHPLTHFVFQVTEPALLPLRQWVPTFSKLDVSPLVAAFICMFFLSILQDLVFGLAVPGLGALIH